MFQSHDLFSEGVHDLIDHVNYEKARDKFFLDGLTINSGTSASEVNFREFVTSVYKTNATKAKLYIYNSTIVSLYGYLENFLEGIAKEFIGKLNDSLQCYSHVPPKIRDIHIDASISLLTKVKKDRGLDITQRDSTVKTIINNMNNCVNEQDDFKLNEAAYAIHTANFRYDNTHELFSKIGIEDLFGGVLHDNKLVEALLARNASEYDVERTILKRWIGQELDDLAQRRNEIAHGSITSDIESMDMFLERADLILKLSNAINDIVWRQYLSIIMEVAPSSVVLNSVAAYPKHSALGFSNLTNLDLSKKNNITLGDLVKCVSGERRRYGVVKSIIHNKNPVEHLTLPVAEDFAIGVDFTVKSKLAGAEIIIASPPVLRTQART